MKSNVTQLVDRLEADGLVTRAADPSDRRSRLAVITEMGKSAYARGTAIQQQSERDIFSGQIAWTHGDIVASAYSTNLTDQHYMGALNSGLRFVGPPRQYGVRVYKRF